jgi:hypothetical protein
MTPAISRGFRGRRREESEAGRVPDLAAGGTHQDGEVRPDMTALGVSRCLTA